MNEHERDRLIEYLKGQAGEALRVVARYDGETYTFGFIRADIDNEYSRVELTEHIKSFRRDVAVAADLERDLQAGNHHCSIRVFDRTLIINFTQGEDIGTIISLDPTVGRDLLSFIGKSLRVLDSTPDEQIKSAPDWV